MSDPPDSGWEGDREALCFSTFKKLNFQLIFSSLKKLSFLQCIA